MPPATIIAVTSSDARHVPVLGRAAAVARQRSARVILFDLDADLGPLESPLPTAWSADGEQEQIGDSLDAADLDAAGQPRLAKQVRSLEEAGVEARGWLPPTADAGALAGYAARQGAELVILSTEDTELIGDLQDDPGVAAGDGPPAGRVHVEAVPPG